MYVVCVTIKVLEPQVESFMKATLDNARNTRHEPGNLRFDVLQDEKASNQFMFYEVYRSAEDFAAHQQTTHYLEWKAKVADWMAEPRVGVRYHSIFPGESDW
jgi:autoinducer 2-degrading protein